ncbi:hypothetical protein [Streptomyces justiciae]|nr:hypothetical protein [Streptomyces justiciae]MBE8478402.1 hypothetical protein [Streptomyces justiciae]
MLRKKNAKRAAFVAASAAFAGALLTQTAFAAQVDAYWHGTHAAVDNNPGSGSAGWVWVYGSTEYKATGGVIKYKLWDGSSGQLDANRGKTNSAGTGSDIRQFQACTNFYIDGYDYQTCGDWVTFG